MLYLWNNANSYLRSSTLNKKLAEKNFSKVCLDKNEILLLIYPFNWCIIFFSESIEKNGSIAISVSFKLIKGSQIDIN